MRSTRNIVLLACLSAALSALALPGSPAAASIEQPRLVSTNPANFTPNVDNGRVLAVAQVGNTIVLGGTFSSVTKGGTTYNRSRLVAFDATTGAVRTGFNPTTDGQVTSLAAAADGTSIYVGGAFNTVNGATHRKVVRLNVGNGGVVGTFSPGAVNGKVNDLKLSGDTLYLGGKFTKVAGQNRSRMASLNATNGSVTGKLNVAFAGVNHGGGTFVSKFDVTPDGSRIVAIGNFTSVEGLSRPQIVMLDTSGASASVSSWATDRYPDVCASVFNTYMRDLDFSPGGDYFIVSTTGAYRGANTLCDSITRWETDHTGAGQEPTWIDHTGGDTTYAVAATGVAVYAGGHMRWLNNSYAGDRAGPGAVPHEGIVALDPVTGLPFSWPAFRARGVGVFDMLATDDGLWLGSDTKFFGGERRQRIAFLPLAGGTAVPAPAVPQLPATALQLGRVGGATDPSVLYRVNAGGPALLSTDDGPDWAGDTGASSPYRNSGSNAASYTTPVTLDASVPSSNDDSTPASLFLTERWDPNDATEMHWNFPVPAGTPLQVRLFFANQYSGTSTAGSRVFDVSVDGSTVLPSFDIVAAGGHQVGLMRSFDITSDGNGVDIAFAHGVENPLIDGIEIIDRSVVSGPTSSSDDVSRTPLSATGAPGSTSTVAGNDSFRHARGAFVIGTTLYTPWSDGTLRARSVSGTTLGAATTVDLYGGGFAGEAANVTGIAYDAGTSRIYYTLAGDSRLFWRWFLPENGLVGTMRFEAPAGALPAADVRGMFVSGGWLYYASDADGALRRIAFDAGTTGNFGPGVSGAPQLVDSSRDWRSRGLTLS
ncbi:MAG: hypothetical protein KDB63_09795 [Nocardioidaceae bacterium]|nr:hypothetical protein [Nocardioidaceae bacterium]